MNHLILLHDFSNQLEVVKVSLPLLEHLNGISLLVCTPLLRARHTCRIGGRCHVRGADDMLIRGLKHHHRLLLARIGTARLQGLLREGAMRINGALVLQLGSLVFLADVAGAGDSVVIALRLSTSLLLVVQLGNLTLVLPGDLLEQLQAGREMLHECMLNLV